MVTAFALANSLCTRFPQQGLRNVGGYGVFSVGLLALIGGALNMTMVLTSRMVRPTRLQMIRVVSLSYLAAFALAGAYLAYSHPGELTSPPELSPILILSVVGSIFIQYVFFYLSVRFPVRITAFSGLLMIPSAILADFVFFGFAPTASRLGCAVIILATSAFRLLTREKGRAIPPEVASQVVAPNAT